MQVVAGVLGRAGESGQQKRLQAAQTGKVTWLPPERLGNPKTEEDRRREEEMRKNKRSLGMAQDAPERPSRGGRRRMDGLEDDDL
jgi:small subunit ribosomal protein S2